MGREAGAVARDFFTAQEQARRRSRWLLLWYVPMAALFSLGVMLCLLPVALLLATVAPHAGLELLHWLGAEGSFVQVCVGSVVFLLLASWWRAWSLAREGGAGIAQALGGVEVEEHMPGGRALRNVVEEMAVAAGVPVPRVFVLPKEHGINAFAAGYAPRDWAVAVTQGALAQLSREELQAVAGHEVSHLVQGDTWLNMRLLSVLAGMQAFFVAGEKILAGALLASSNGSQDDTPLWRQIRWEMGRAFWLVMALMLLGALLLMVGATGMLGARLVQAMVVRQREFLADAGAVQFTRNPLALAAALRKMAQAGTQVHHPQESEMAHFFFAGGESWAGRGNWLDRLLSSHPPLAERIRRLDARGADDVPEQPVARVMLDAAPAAMQLGGDGPVAPVAAWAIAEGQTAVAARALAAVPADVRAAARSRDTAEYVLYAVLVSPAGAGRREQARELAETLSREHALWVLRWARALRQAGEAVRLPVLDICLPALRGASEAMRADVLRRARALLAASGAAGELFAQVMLQVVAGVLAPVSTHPLAGRFRPAQLEEKQVLVLALLARQGHAEEEAAQAAFAAALSAAQLPPQPLPRQPSGVGWQLETALDVLARASLPWRRRFLEVCTIAIRHDSMVTTAEAELLRAVAQALGCAAPL